MKNEGRIMEANMDNNKIEINNKKTEQNPRKDGNLVEMNVNNTTSHGSPEKPGTLEKGETNNEQKMGLLRKQEAKEQLDKALKEKKIVVGVDKEGEPVEKTVLDVIEGGREAMGELIKTDKWSEKSVESFSDTKKLVEWSESEDGKKFVDSLVNKDVKDDSEKKEVKSIVDIILKDVWEGDIDEGKKWFKSQVDKSKDVKVGDSAGKGEFVKDFELNDREQYVLDNMFSSNKIVPAPGEGSGGAEEAGQVIPAPDVKDGIPELPKDNAPSEKEIDDLKKKIIKHVKEKKKIDWVKYGNFLLFLIIVGAGFQGWYAKMWEQFAERAR